MCKMKTSFFKQLSGGGALWTSVRFVTLICFSCISVVAQVARPAGAYGGDAAPMQGYQEAQMPAEPQAQPVYQQVQEVHTPPASGKPKIVVYVSEHRGMQQDHRSALRTRALSGLHNSGRFEVIERSNVIETELLKQTSGAIDDDQLTAFGRQLGARYICVADMTHLRDRREAHTRQRCPSGGNCYTETYHTNHKDYQVSARIIDVETAELLALGVIEEDIQKADVMMGAIDKAVGRMLGTMQQARPELPRMAIYITGDGSGGRGRWGSGNSGMTMYTYALESLFKRSRSNGDFRVVERSEAFTSQIAKEQTTQRSGHIDDSQIARLGKQYGIQRILVAQMDHVMGNYTLSGRLLNIESAAVERASRGAYTDASDLRKLKGMTESIVEEIVQWRKTPEELVADREAKRIKQEEEA